MLVGVKRCFTLVKTLSMKLKSEVKQKNKYHDSIIHKGEGDFEKEANKG